MSLIIVKNDGACTYLSLFDNIITVYQYRIEFYSKNEHYIVLTSLKHGLIHEMMLMNIV